MKVSVLLQTYNHEKLVAQAIESVLAQETNFDFELIILEDCSTDSTRSIVIDFQRRHPEYIRLILPEKNKGDNTNLVAAWQASRSQYVAWLDGDDYWTSPYKLQRQVDFLDTHLDYAMCYHNVEVLYEDGSQEFWHPNWQPYRFTLQEGRDRIEDLLETQFIPGCSPMFRKGLLSEFPKWYYSDDSPDWTLYVLMAQHGKIGYIDKSMGVYRVHSGGIWSGIDRARQAEQIAEFYKNIGYSIDHKYEDMRQKMEALYSRESELRSGRFHKVLAVVNAHAGIRRVRRIVKRILPVRVRHLIRALWRLQYRVSRNRAHKFYR